ncbi:MAG TPA: glycosyltransferase [Gaiellales bacterium]|nr:glycosyltransferase [Gaiellales bacterium]
MRILFTFAGGSGHLEPLVPIARAASAGGHEVAFAGRPLMIPAVRALGFSAHAIGTDSGLAPERLPLREPDPEREDEVLRDGFARRIARERAQGLLPLCGQWRPDLLVCDETDFGAIVVAERLGLLSATVLTSPAGSFVRPGLLADALGELRAEHGLPPDPELAMLSRFLVLTPAPRSYRDPAFPLPGTAHGVRLFTPQPGASEDEPDWIADLLERPMVYVTLGTVFNVESGDLFARILEGLRHLPANVVMTVGREIDPAEFGPQPPSVRVEQYVPQASLLPHCSAVVSHGGSGTVMGALAHGLPMVLIPLGADQPANAARCAELGIARVLDAVRATPEQVLEAVSVALLDPVCRRAAQQMRDEIAALPGPVHAVALLERLATERRPLLAE